MGRFTSPATQAAGVMKVLQGDVIKSVGTARNYEQAFRRIGEFLKEHRLGSLRSLTIESAIKYLELRSQAVRQSTLNMERQAIQVMLKYVSNRLSEDQKLPTVKSELETVLNSRAYSKDQIEMISLAQSSRNALATEIAYRAGLRAHELYSLRLASERPADFRPGTRYKFKGREGVRYTVHGKGGLIRDVMLPRHLSEKLESRRLPEPELITDRQIHIKRYYDINGGHRWSSSFSKAAKRTLGWSEGAHGVRHAYAQERMDELTADFLDRNIALETVSQEMGHFRPGITEVYLR